VGGSVGAASSAIALTKLKSTRGILLSAVTSLCHKQAGTGSNSMYVCIPCADFSFPSDFVDQTLPKEHYPHVLVLLN